MGGREGEDGQALGQVVLHPEGEFGCGWRVGQHEILESGGRGGEIGAEEDGANVGGDFGALIKAGNISLGILLEVELAALPGNGGKDGGPGGGEAGMGITDDEGEAVKTAVLEGVEEGAPVDFGLAQGDADTQDGAFAIKADAHGYENGAVQELAALADLLVAGIKDHVGACMERAFAPGLEFAVEPGGAGADLGRADAMAAKLLDDFGDLAGGYALDIHLGQSKLEGLFAADALFESAGVKVHAVADLRNTELNGADAGSQGLGFEAVGTALTGVTTLVGPGLEDSRAFLDHGLVDEQAEALGKSAGTFGGEKLQNGGQKIRIDLVGHVWVFVGSVWLHPNRDHTGPLPASFGAKPHPGPSAFGSLRSPSLRRPRMGRSGEKTNYRRTFTPPSGIKRKVKNRCGTPQGGVVSPLLANLYLDGLDKAVNGGRHMKAVMVRFADDFVILCRKGQGAEMKRQLGSWLERRKLRLNEKKTRIVDFARESFEFLGFRLESRKARSGKSYPHCEPSAKSCNKLREAIREQTGRDTLWKSSEEVFAAVNRRLRGWIGYFHYANSTRVFDKMQWNVREKLRRWLWKKHARTEALYGPAYSDESLHDHYGLIRFPMATKWQTL